MRRPVFHRSAPMSAVLAAFVLLLSGAGRPALADAKSDAQKAIQAVYNKINAATLRKDAKAVLSYYADNIVVNAGGQSLTKTQIRQLQAQMSAMPQIKPTKATSVIQKFSLQGGDTATCTVRNVAAVQMPAPAGSAQAGKPLVIASDGTAQDTWKKTGKGWLLVRSDVLSAKSTMNGKPLMPGGMGGGGARPH